VFTLRSIKDSATAGSGRDTIYDFSASERDKIDLSPIDARTSASGNQAFTFISTESFSGQSGELRYEKAVSGTYIYGDVNGDQVADLTIRLMIASPSRRAISFCSLPPKPAALRIRVPYTRPGSMLSRVGFFVG
jgi:hypothetical protein